MNTQKITVFMNKIARTLGDKSPEILTGLGVAGLVTTVIFTARGTIKACEIVEEERYDREQAFTNGPEDAIYEDLSKKEIVQLTWKCYVPTVVMGGASIACIIGAHSVSARRNAALASLYSLSESALKEYKDKVKETIGEKKESQIREKLAEDKLMANPVDKANVTITGKGDTLCFDVLSGRYFKSSMEAIRKAENDFNQQLLSGDYCLSLNELYGFMSLDYIGLGEDIGWTANRMLRFNFVSKLASNGTPCLVVDYDVRPSADFHNF